MRSLCVFLVVVIIQHMNNPAADAKMHRGRNWMFVKCCEVEETPAATQHKEKIKQLADECNKEIGKLEGDDNRGKCACLTECIAKRTNVLNEDKTLNEDGFKQYVNEMATQEHEQAVAETAATKCTEFAKSKFAGDGGDASKCSKIQIGAIKCAMKELFESCPADLQTKSEQCDKVREMVKNGKKKPSACGETELDQK